jgi:hypothetical protein
MNAFGEVRVPGHICNPQVLQIDRVVGSQERERRLVMEVSALTLHGLMCPCQHSHGFAATVAPLFLRRDTRRWHFAKYRSARL